MSDDPKTTTPLTECQASMFDGECIHPHCPVDWRKIATGADPSVQCPLSWLRSRDGDDYDEKP